MTQVRLNQSQEKASTTGPAKRRFRRWYVTLPLLLVLGYIALGFTTDYIPSESMLPTLHPGDHVVTMRTWLAYPLGRMPERGDIITFRSPMVNPDSETGASNSPEEDPVRAVFHRIAHERTRAEILIKRVIGLPGEKVLVHDGKVSINGIDIAEDYIIPSTAGDEGGYGVEEPLTVPPGQLFVLGDNRDNSDDSRYWGTLKRSDVTGKFVCILFHRDPKTQ